MDTQPVPQSRYFLNHVPSRLLGLCLLNQTLHSFVDLSSADKCTSIDLFAAADFAHVLLICPIDCFELVDFPFQDLDFILQHEDIGLFSVLLDMLLMLIDHSYNRPILSHWPLRVNFVPVSARLAMLEFIKMGILLLDMLRHLVVWRILVVKLGYMGVVRNLLYRKVVFRFNVHYIANTFKACDDLIMSWHSEALFCRQRRC